MTLRDTVGILLVINLLIFVAPSLIYLFITAPSCEQLYNKALNECKLQNDEESNLYTICKDTARLDFETCKRPPPSPSRNSNSRVTINL